LIYRCEEPQERLVEPALRGQLERAAVVVEEL
jgi:hypothetical protein